MKAVRSATSSRPPPELSSSTNVSLSQRVRPHITSSPTKSCALDTIPTFLLKELIDVLLPLVTAMVNASLRDGQLPSLRKHVVV